jgi:hypothetical protein
VLQTSYGQKYLILTLNPIVDLYEDCKNVLATSLFRSLLSQSKNEESKDIDINKDTLNDMARKKLELLER